jgi:dTDP-4-dehydrorhamnose 3,5-epimerase
MQIIDTPPHDVKLIRPKIYGDECGWFAEVFNANAYAAAGLPACFVQNNQSFSQHGVLRGLHYQVVQPQGKLVRALSRHIWDVAVAFVQARHSLGNGRVSTSAAKTWSSSGFRKAMAMASSCSLRRQRTVQNHPLPQGRALHALE